MLNFRDFVNGIRFDDSGRVIFPESDKELKYALEGPMRVPKMSSEAIGGIINFAVFSIPSNLSYLNIGTWAGYTLFAGMTNNPDKICIGVDNFSESGGPEAEFMSNFNSIKSPQHYFFKEDYRKYLAYHNQPIGVYYYDGPHTYQDQLDGLLLAEKHFVPGTIIMVDDTNGTRERKGTFDFLSRSPLDYEIIADLPTPGNHHHTFHNGLIVLRKTRLAG